MNGLRVVLLGDGPWAARTLEQLQPTLHVVAAVVLRARPSDQSLADAAERLGIPVLQPDRINDHASITAIAALRPDVLLSIAYDQILGAAALGSARVEAINVHAGMLPRYRGRNVINWAIVNGETELGITVHIMDSGIDTGDILLQRRVPIGWTDTYGDVLSRAVAAIPELASDALDALAGGDPPRTPQQSSEATYFGGRGPGDEWLDWSQGSATLHNKIRAIAAPGPGARTSLDGHDVVVWQAFFDPAWPRYIATPGQVVGRSSAGATVKTGDSTLLVQRIAAAGEEPKVPDWPVGTRLDENPLRALVDRLTQRSATR